MDTKRGREALGSKAVLEPRQNNESVTRRDTCDKTGDTGVTCDNRDKTGDASDTGDNSVTRSVKVSFVVFMIKNLKIVGLNSSFFIKYKHGGRFKQLTNI